MDSSSEEPVEDPTPKSSLSATNSMIYEIGDEVCYEAFKDFISNYSSTIISDREWMKKYK